MTYLGDDELIASYQREVAPLGQFDTLFPGVSADAITGALADGFGRAQLEGFFQEHSMADYTVTPDLSASELSLVVLYAGINHLRTQIANTENRALYEAGPVKYETERTASTLNALLRDAQDRANAVRAALAASQMATPITTVDAYAARQGWI